MGCVGGDGGWLAPPHATGMQLILQEFTPKAQLLPCTTSEQSFTAAGLSLQKESMVEGNTEMFLLLMRPYPQHTEPLVFH